MALGLDHKKSRVANIWRYFGDPAVSGRPVGFPPHPRGWFSIIVYQVCWYSVTIAYKFSYRHHSCQHIFFYNLLILTALSNGR